jgi:peptide/nickel transport system permease protein
MSRSDEVSVFNRDETDVSLGRQDIIKRWFTLWVISPAKIAWDDYRTRIGGSIILLYVLMGTVGVHIIKSPANRGEFLLPPFQSMRFPLGTDNLGNDMLALMVHSTPAMWQLIIAGAIVAGMFGTAIGTLAGYARGRIDVALMTFTDIMLTIPGLPLIIVLAAAIEPENPFVVGTVLAINNWPGLARTVRSQVLSLREESYVEASRIMGFSKTRIITKDIIPNVAPYLLIGFVGAATSVVFEAVGLYFLGVLPFTRLNWGVILQQAQSGGAIQSVDAVHWLLVPMITISLLTFGFILTSQGLDRVFNPRIRAKHANDRGEEIPEN